MWYCKEENKNTNKEKGKKIETRVAARRYLLSQTYTLMPDTTQRNSKECCIWTCSHVHAGKAMTISENNGKCRWYLQSNNRQIRWQKDKELSGGVFLKKKKRKKKKNNFYFSWKVTQSRYKYYFYVEFLDGGKWKNHFPVLFSGNMAQLMNFMGLLIFPIK